MSLIPSIPGTGIAAAASGSVLSSDVVFQLINGYLDISRGGSDLWNTEHLNVKPVDGTPLAAISRGNEFRVYYLNSDYVIQELVHIEGRNVSIGDIGKLNVKAVPGSGLAAIGHAFYAAGESEPNQIPGFTIRVFYQEPGSNLVRELVNGISWEHGNLRIPDALGGTSLAAATYYFDGQFQTRVYYQAIGLNLKEYGHNASGWFQGEFNPGQATNQTPLAALAFGSVQLQVYWRDLHGRVVFERNTGKWNPVEIVKPIGPGYKFATIQLENGKELRFYYQNFDGGVVGYGSKDSGKTWSVINLKVGSSE
jgi:hypothetical protein